MKSAEIRGAFLKYFEGKGHTIVASSSLVPGNDPTLLFTNAGMVQFKDVFLGTEKSGYSRATSSQRCVRAGGKHNDLENVGYTARHHTFFEMLGNFSFGDYFKQEAIHFAWEFLTSNEWLGIPADKLTVTVYQDDEDAYRIWKEDVGVPEQRIIRIGDKKGEKYNSDNFWAMGDTGPCGPCTEIFYDHGEDIWGGPPGSPEEDGDRFIEIWNVVFMQYNRSASGEMAPLPKPSVDTGMGLERIAAVKQSVHSNYEIDLFQALIKAAASVTAATDLEHKSLRVIADHIRSCAFLVVDGVLPSNEGRGYVLRRIIRRALRHGHKLGQSEPFFHQLVTALVEQMGDAYPELAQQAKQIAKVLLAEEEQFAKTLDRGMEVLESEIGTCDNGKIPGELIFRLYDTYGFPVDLTNDIAREKSLELDMAGYETCMEEQRNQARAASKFGLDYTAALSVQGDTTFNGYDSLTGEAQVAALFIDGEAVDAANQGDKLVLQLDQTPFYGESGGQVGDSGEIASDNCRIVVTDCIKQGPVHLHIGEVAEGRIQQGEQVAVRVDVSTRMATALNHSATHLLHAALRAVLGDHVAQQGSLVDAEKLRFDFSHFEAMTTAEIKQVERLVNNEIRRNSAVITEVMTPEAAQEKGAMALFGEKYSDEVRVLTMGDGFSMELCGGTHVRRTGDIGLLKVASETGIASGVRRIEAVTGETALDYLDQFEEAVQRVAGELKTSQQNVVSKARQLTDANKQLTRELDGLKRKLASSAGSDLVAQAREISGIKVLAAKLEGVDPKSLRDTVDQLKDKLGTGVVLLATEADGKVLLVAGVTKNATDRVKAGDLMKFAAERVGGKGGGRPDMAQGGGTDVAAVAELPDAVHGWVAEQLS